MKQEKIGKFIANRRKEQCLTQVQFAEKLGVTNKAVSKWETGKCLPDAALFNDICLLLNITLNELFSGEKIAPENIEKKAEENLISMAIEYQKRDYRILSTVYITIFIMIIGIAVNISVGGMWMEGSPVFSNLLFTFLFIVSWGIFSKLTHDDIPMQKISFIFSLIVLISSVVAFTLTFWDVERHITFWFGIPCEILFYGLKIICDWIHIYAIASMLSLINLIFCKKNISTSITK